MSRFGHWRSIRAVCHGYLTGIHFSTIQRQIMKGSCTAHKRPFIHCKFHPIRESFHNWCTISFVICIIYLCFAWNWIDFVFFFRQTMVLVFYLLCIILMMIVRPILNVYFLKNGKMAVYSALYFIPILALFHTIIGGLMCKFEFFYQHTVV